MWLGMTATKIEAFLLVEFSVYRRKMKKTKPHRRCKTNLHSSLHSEFKSVKKKYIYINGGRDRRNRFIITLLVYYVLYIYIIKSYS